MQKHIDLFTGIGGMTLALEGISKPAAYCDKKPFSRLVLNKLMKRKWLPEAPVFPDIAVLKRAPILIDYITAGFPCTGFSAAGSMTGFQHAESAVFTSLVRVCQLCRPRMILLENAPTIFHNKAYRTHVTRSFSKIGYSMLHCIVRATDVNLPHRRSRWFAVAVHPTFTKGEALRIRNKLDKKWLPVHRQPLRCTPNKDTLARKRFDLLKNSVVPNAARLALFRLMTTFVSEDVPCTSAPPSVDVSLTHKQGNVVFKKKLWPTPHGAWFDGSPTLNERGCRDLPTAVRHEISTKPGHFNVQWVEWLMGYKASWTDPR